MKDKEKQIEEMAKVIDMHNWKLTDSEQKEIAEALYNADYQKIDKDSVVLSSEQYSDYLITQTNCEWLKEKVEKLQADNERLYKNLGKFKETISKETAEKIFKWLKKHTFDSSFIIVETYFKEEFGVKIKE